MVQYAQDDVLYEQHNHLLITMVYIYIHSDYPGSFYDVIVLRHSFKLARVIHTQQEYFQYLFKDPTYLDKEMYIMRRFDRDGDGRLGELTTKCMFGKSSS